MLLLRGPPRPGVTLPKTINTIQQSHTTLSFRHGGLLLAYRPVLLGHRGLGENEVATHMRHELHCLVHRIELNGIVQEEKIRLVMRVTFHLAHQRLLVRPLQDTGDLLIEPQEVWCLEDPI